MKSKTKFWAVIWAISMGAGTSISQLHDIKYSLANKTPPPADPLSTAPTSSSAYMQLFLMLLYVPLITLPISLRMVFCAKKENNRPIQIIGIVAISLQIIGFLSTLIRWIA